MLDARIYRAALVPVLLAVIVSAFSLGDQSAPMGTTLAPDAFSGETIDGKRTLTTVLARQVGEPGPELLVVAHRDAAKPGSRAELSGTAAMLELARIVAGGRLRRTVTFVSTSGGSGGAAGARDLAEQVKGNRIDAVLVLGDLGTRDPRRPLTVRWSDGSKLGPLRLKRTVDQAVRNEVATDPGGPSPVTQWTRLAFPGTVSEQGPFVAAGLPAVLLSASGERPPAAAAPVDENRVEAYGRAALRTLVALDEGPVVGTGPTRDIVTLGKVLPAWAVRLLIGSLLLAPLLVTIDGFARARRRHHAVSPWLGWIATAAAPFALAAALATVLGITGLLSATPPDPVPADAIPIDSTGRAALIGTGLVFVLAVVARPLILRATGGRKHLDGPGAGAALLLAWCALAALLWVVNPFAAAFMVPAAHLWLALVAPELRLRRWVALMLVAISLLPFAIAALVLAGQYGLDPLRFVWALLLAVAGAQVGPVAWLFWSLAASCALAAIVLAWRTRPPPPVEVSEPKITVRGPASYAGPGSLGGTESALRR